MDNNITYFLIATISGFLLALLKVLYSSKCSHIKCFCVDIERDINNEVKEDIENIKNNTN